MPAVDAAADAHQRPFPSSTFQGLECDAVLERVRNPAQVIREIERATGTRRLRPSADAILPSITLDGLKGLAGSLEVAVSAAIRGPLPIAIRRRAAVPHPLLPLAA
jgi:hypothetical protein